MIKGLSIPFYALYNFSAGAVSYTNGGRVGKAVTYSTDIQVSEGSNFHGDNDIAETENGKFTGGTLTLETTNLSQELSLTLFGLKSKNVMVGESQVPMNVYDDDAKSPDIGFGIIEWHQVDNVDSYRAVILMRTYFNLPGNSANTMGESVDWQTRQITGVIKRSELNNETEKHPWMYEAWVDTEAEALALLEEILGVPEG